MANKRITHHEEGWKGYTLDELRYQRALNSALLEIEKEKLMLGFQDMKNGLPGGNPRGLLGKIAGSLSYLDYAVLAFKFGRTILHTFRSLRRR